MTVIVIGEKSLAKNEIEYKHRRASDSEYVPQESIVDFIKNAISAA